MISRRVFLKDGGLALVSLGFAPQLLARTVAGSLSEKWSVVPSPYMRRAASTIGR